MDDIKSQIEELENDLYRATDAINDANYCFEQLVDSVQPLITRADDTLEQIRRLASSVQKNMVHFWNLADEDESWALAAWAAAKAAAAINVHFSFLMEPFWESEQARGVFMDIGSISSSSGEEKTGKHLAIVEALNRLHKVEG